MAPFAGVVSKVGGEVGERSGASSGDGAFITLISEERQLRLAVNEADIGKVKPDQEVSFTVAAYPERNFSGRVKSIYPQGSTVSNVQVFDVLVDFADPEGLIRPGMTATASIVVAKRENVLVVPQVALSYASSYLREGRAGLLGPGRREFRGGGGSEGGSPAGGERQLVLVLEGDKPVPRRVRTGLSDRQYVEVLEGLSAGEKVVIGSATAGRQAASPGATGGSRTTQQRQAPLPGVPGAPGGRMQR
ncbi:efflux RND transporter periplasmic adaptor subunit [Desulfovirgula thermocuniculi]|uniref:efflux RND transporter periplasmic adaptor subunit n=1 Tax=Desulfovirgula thermocuniculi TaxID=348842 RepID=UPI0004082A11|nr:efflux RND transporter periplasmic adaptor subunit [Desulfovirgula thermocuniculi]